ncbi:Similar to Leucine aminopeptidase 2; acc. no. C5FTZ6 [Pyronema omphalodes CBS 100304]|uniref:Peptide hydrolase n=1 Tax=Pyronema omphalodes (strain CBS 100304) TaxID=1076935 RepID=U4LC45_PYROM|nr:Similar to Leucine aminopeptidase 2; acc. no. C5FTZ6 [Pyronema omphalodes CBS 100304]
MRPPLPLLLLSLSLVTAAPQTSPSVAPPSLSNSVHPPNLLSTLQSLSTIASSNNGNRAFGLPGYTASKDFILQQIRQYPSLHVKEQPFQALFTKVESIYLSEIGGDPVYVHGLTFSPSTPKEGITADLKLGPKGEGGCGVAGYAGLDVKDKIVLIQRFKCPDNSTFSSRVKAAAKAGAAAVIIYNDVETKPTAGGLRQPDPEGLRPAGLIGLEDGRRWEKRLEAGESLRVKFEMQQNIEMRETWNLVAETKGGDPAAVVMFGAHLDSVQAGPGINDDGSGVSLVLELLRLASRLRPELKLRFCFWGAEENGKIGSQFYVSQLQQHQLQNIRAYLNFDMLIPPSEWWVSQGYFGVFDGDGSTHGLRGAPGSEVIEQLLTEHLSQREKVVVTPAIFTGGSDYASFMAAGVPVGGLHTGTGVKQDKCYHQACDGLENANATILEMNTRAAAYVMGRLAMEGRELIPRWSGEQVGSMSLGSLLINTEEIQWGVEEGGRHTGCGEEPH